MSENLEEFPVSPAFNLEDLTPNCEDCMTRWTQGHIQPRQPFRNPSPEDTCPICREQYDCGRHAPFVIAKVEGCVGYVFGLSCLINWLVSDMNPDSCPICRSQLFNYAKRDHDGIERRVQNIPLPGLSVEAVAEVLVGTVQQMRDLENSIRNGQRISEDVSAGGEYTEDEIREILEDAAEWEDYTSDDAEEDEDDPGHDLNGDDDDRDEQGDGEENGRNTPDGGDMSSSQLLSEQRDQDDDGNDQTSPQRQSRNGDTESVSESAEVYECPTLKRVRNNIIDNLLVVYFKQRYTKSVADIATQTDEPFPTSKKNVEVDSMDQKSEPEQSSSLSNVKDQSSDILHWVVPGVIILALGVVASWVAS